MKTVLDDSIIIVRLSEIWFILTHPLKDMNLCFVPENQLRVALDKLKANLDAILLVTKKDLRINPHIMIFVPDIFLTRSADQEVLL